MVNLKKTKELLSIAQEWDLIAELREQQISSGKDHSANCVLGPAILDALPKVDYLIDIGCGTGWLTSRAAMHAKAVVGLDPSKKSIAIAQAKYARNSITYNTGSIEQYACNQENLKFDAAISNMVASNTPNLKSFFSASRKIIKKNGLFIITIPHPYFWPVYWGYASHPEFYYQNSFAVESVFKIRKQSTNMLTTHFHHPLEQYFSALINTNFSINIVRELYGQGFSLPRFMLIVAHAI